VVAAQDDPARAPDDLTGEECWELVRSAGIGRIAACIYGRPYVLPVDFVADGQSIVFRTGTGTKLAAAVLGRELAFEVDGCDPSAGEAWSVVVTGPAVEVAAPPWPGSDAGAPFAAADLPVSPWHRSTEVRFIRIRAEEVSGRRLR
jgi:hypothetical protein